MNLSSNDVEMTSLGYGLLLGAVGVGLGSMSLSIIASIAQTRRNAQRLLGPGSDEARARVLSKEIYPKVDEPKRSAVPGGEVMKSFFLVGYVFDAVRADGTTCRVEVRQRKVPSFVWEALTEGCTVPVRFLKQEPRHCRITAAAEHESRGIRSFRARALLALLLMVCSVVAGAFAVLDGHLAGALLWAAGLIVAAVWQLTGRRVLQATCPCCRRCLQARQWSPLFIHAGCVFSKELGQDIHPSADPEPLLPHDVELAMGIHEPLVFRG